jgi:hypothetical protein
MDDTITYYLRATIMETSLIDELDFKTENIRNHTQLRKISLILSHANDRNKYKFLQAVLKNVNL